MATLLLITKGSSNKLVVSAKELSESEGTLYKFVFIRIQGKARYEITLEDQSLYPQSYNLFTLIEGEDLTFSEQKGQYKYEVYDDQEKLVDQGKMLLITQEEREEYFFESTESDNYLFS